MCARDPVYWFNRWVWTFNPKNTGTTDAAILPMELFPRQEEAIRWLRERSARKEDGLFEKSRDIGFTWMCGGYALHRWLFEENYKATFGSRKAEYVDRIGDPDSIFEKIRIILKYLPAWQRPRDFSDNSMLIVNHENGSTIRGEAGDDMGRGGRSTDYMLDEFAFIERAESVDASTSANADTRIFGSSVNGHGNLFARKRHNGQMRPDQIFRFHWTDDPRKNNPEWEKLTKAKVEAHVWASEYDIDYSASVEGICILAKWVEAAKKIKDVLWARGLRLPTPLNGVAGGDIGAGKAKSVIIPRFGPEVRQPKSWSDPDTVNTAHRMLMYCESMVTEREGFMGAVKSLRYDATGIGHGVGSVMQRSDIDIRPVSVLVGNPPSDMEWPDGKTSKEKFLNIKGESWWIGREKFKNTYEHMLFLTDPAHEEAIEHPLEDLISLPSDASSPDALILNAQISLVKWGTNTTGKIVIESKDALAKRQIPSPDHADALMLTFVPETTAELLEKAYAA